MTDKEYKINESILVQLRKGEFFVFVNNKAIKYSKNSLLYRELENFLENLKVWVENEYKNPELDSDLTSKMLKALSERKTNTK